MFYKIKYLFSRIFKLDFKRMVKQANIVRERTNKNLIFILLDMIICGALYQAGYMDYVVFEMYNVGHKQRKTYVTRGINNKIVRKLNDKNYWHCLEDKVEFNKIFADFIKRDYIDLRVSTALDLKKFLEDKEYIIVKPIDATCGVGIKKLKVNEIVDIIALFKQLVDEKILLVEDCIKQHPKMNELYSDSVNTLRIVSILNEGKVSIVFAGIRIGNGGVVDNINNGGMASVIDVNTGIILKPAADKDGKTYLKHPITNTEIVGFEVPCYKNVIEMVIIGANVVPQLGYIAWDVAISEDGPLFIEGNHFPGHDIYQFSVHLDDDKMGLLPIFKKAVKI